MTILAVETVTSLVLRNTDAQVFEFIPNILWATGILLLTYLARGTLIHFLRKALGRTEPALRKFFIQTSEILLFVFGVVAALDRLGIKTASIVTVLGAAGLAVGLALQNTLSQFAAGVLLISLRPFEVGDFIEGAGVAGVVDSIGIFSTTLLTRDNVLITVPNGQLFNGTLKNLTAMGTRRVDLEIDIGDRPIELTMTQLLTLVQLHPLILAQPPPTCHVASITATTTILYLRPWCSAGTYEQVRSEVQKLVKETLF